MLTSLRLWALLNAWKIVKPKPISESDVRMIDISVRSAASRVRWYAMPVRRAPICTEGLPAAGVAVGCCSVGRGM